MTRRTSKGGCGSESHGSHFGIPVAPGVGDFVCQGVTGVLRGTDGKPLPARSVDLVNASGVVGHHLSPETIGIITMSATRK